MFGIFLTRSQSGKKEKKIFAKIYTQVKGGRFARGLLPAMTWPLVAVKAIAVPRDHPFSFRLNFWLLLPFSSVAQGGRRGRWLRHFHMLQLSSLLIQCKNALVFSACTEWYTYTTLITPVSGSVYQSFTSSLYRARFSDKIPSRYSRKFLAFLGEGRWLDLLERVQQMEHQVFLQACRRGWRCFYFVGGWYITF